MTREELHTIVSESLRDWFKKEKWVRISSSGDIAGPCGTSKNKKNPDRCLPIAKAQSLTKGERAATARKKKAAGAKGKTVVANTKKAKVTEEKIERLKKQILNEQKQDMKFKVPKLNYSYTSLQPYIDKETMEEHFGKHFKGYTDKLNAELNEKSIRIEAKDQIQAIQIILGKYSKNNTIKNNGGGFYNHVLYFENLTPDYKAPSTKFRKMLEENFNSFSEFKEQFKEAGLKQFGSGWVFLIKKANKLVIESYANQDNPYLDKDFNGEILIAMDVWEHSYYLKHKSQRGNYIDDFFRVVDYKIAEERLEEEPITENVAPNHDGKAAPYGSGFKKVTREDIQNLVVGLIHEMQNEDTIMEKDDRCTRIAKRKYDTWPSAYASGAVVRCRRGEIWKNEK